MHWFGSEGIVGGLVDDGDCRFGLTYGCHFCQAGACHGGGPWVEVSTAAPYFVQNLQFAFH